MTDKTKGIAALISGIVLLIVGVTISVIAYKTKLMTAFDYVKNKGAISSTIFPGSLEYSGYRFFTNNRVVLLSNDKRGTYTKELITFDDGTKVLLIDIFK